MIYLLHADKPLGTGTGKGSAQHYLGYCDDNRLGERMWEHQNNKSNVAIIKAFHQVGAHLSLVKVWPGAGRSMERYLKNNHNIKKECPICYPPRQGYRPPVAVQLGLPGTKQDATRFAKRISKIVGEVSLGNPTFSDGWYHPQAGRESTTTSPSPVDAGTVPTGGSASSATAPSNEPVSTSAGTKQPSSLGSSERPGDTTV